MHELLTQIKTIVADLFASAGEYSGVVASARQYILDNFGQTGLIAAYITLGVLIVFVVSRLVMMTVAAVKYLVVPAVVLAFVASLVLPVTFGVALPVTVTLCSLVLLFKG
jgi:hypothetical protein